MYARDARRRGDVNLADPLRTRSGSSPYARRHRQRAHARLHDVPFRLVPRRFAQFGIAAGSLALLTAILVLFGAYKQVSGPSTILMLPEAVWELSRLLRVLLTARSGSVDGSLSGRPPWRRRRWLSGSRTNALDVSPSAIGAGRGVFPRGCRRMGVLVVMALLVDCDARGEPELGQEAGCGGQDQQGDQACRSGDRACGEEGIADA